MAAGAALIAAGIAVAGFGLAWKAGYPVAFFGLLLALAGTALAGSQRLNGGGR